MAKKDKGKGKVPKKIAGVKIPKALRKGVVGSLFDNPRTREILADVLIAAAGAAAAALVKHRPTGEQVMDAGEAVMDGAAGAGAAARDAVQSAAGAVTEAVADTARQILPASLTATEDENGGEDSSESYAHLADRDRKDKKEKHRPKASKH